MQALFKQSVALIDQIVTALKANTPTPSGPAASKKRKAGQKKLLAAKKPYKESALRDPDSDPNNVIIQQIKLIKGSEVEEEEEEERERIPASSKELQMFAGFRAFVLRLLLENNDSIALPITLLSAK